MAKYNLRKPGAEKLKPAYFTKRKLISVTTKAIKVAYNDAMALRGYVVIADEGWVVRKYADGRIEKLNPIPEYDKYMNMDVKLD